MNAEYAGAFRILKGTECDILRYGALDYDEETLATFDFVVASIHSLFNLPPEEQTQRLIRAIENPYCSILGHPTGRILLEREGYAPNLERVIDRAGELGVAIEINADPHRLRPRLALPPLRQRSRCTHPNMPRCAHSGRIAQHPLRRGHRAQRLAHQRGRAQHARRRRATGVLRRPACAPGLRIRPIDTTH